VAEHKAGNGGSIIPSVKTRAYLYGLMVAAAPIVVFYGLMTLAETGLWIAFGGVALGVSNAIAYANRGSNES